MTNTTETCRLRKEAVIVRCTCSSGQYQWSLQIIRLPIAILISHTEKIVFFCLSTNPSSDLKSAQRVGGLHPSLPCAAGLHTYFRARFTMYERHAMLAHQSFLEKSLNFSKIHCNHTTKSAISDPCDSCNGQRPLFR